MLTLTLYPYVYLLARARFLNETPNAYTRKYRLKGVIMTSEASVPSSSLLAPSAPETIDDRLAADLRGFGPLGIASILVILAGNAIVLPLSGLLVLLWARWSRTPWREIGYVRPKSWIGSAAIGIVFGVAFKLLMKTIVMPLLGAAAINPAYHYLAGNAAALPAILWAVTAGAGFGEETVFRGFLFERLRKLFGTSPWAQGLIVVVT